MTASLPRRATERCHPAVGRRVRTSSSSAIYPTTRRMYSRVPGRRDMALASAISSPTTRTASRRPAARSELQRPRLRLSTGSPPATSNGGAATSPRRREVCHANSAPSQGRDPQAPDWGRPAGMLSLFETVPFTKTRASRHRARATPPLPLRSSRVPKQQPAQSCANGGGIPAASDQGQGYCGRDDGPWPRRRSRIRWRQERRFHIDARSVLDRRRMDGRSAGRMRR
jgi:hypothetical protein